MAKKKKNPPTKKAPTRKKTASKKIAAKPKKKPSRPAKPKVKKPASPAVAAPPFPWRVPLAGETKLGVVEDYFSHVGVIALKLEGSLAVGDKIHVRGHTTDLVQSVDSMQLDHQAVTQGHLGDSIGIHVSDKCRKGDYVFRC